MAGNGDRVRSGIVRTLTAWQRRQPGMRWGDERRVRVLIETWPGFTEELWCGALDVDYAGWRQCADVRFVRGRFERLALLPAAQVYATTALTADLLARAGALRWVHLALAGTEFLEGLTLSPHLTVTTSAGLAAERIAEHALGLIFALDRRLDTAIGQQRHWRWQQRPFLRQTPTVRDRTVGIIGLGQNGQALARLARGLGMAVIGLTRQPGCAIDGVEVVQGEAGLQTLLGRADFIVLCTALTRQTAGLIDRAALQTMGRDAYLINVARGKLVDEAALAWALRRGIIAGAALDVLSQEPPPRRHPLRGCPNLIITPHVAGNIIHIREEIAGRFARNLHAFVDNNGASEGLYRQS